VPPFRPRIGIKQIDARERAIGQPVDEFAGVAVMQADVGERIVFDRGERLADGVDETVAGDECATRICLRLRDQMFGTAETDFKPHLVKLKIEKFAQIGGRRLAKVERDTRQQSVEQRQLPRPQRMTLAAAEEGALGLVAAVVTLAHIVIVRASARHDNGK